MQTHAHANGNAKAYVEIKTGTDGGREWRGGRLERGQMRETAD